MPEDNNQQSSQSGTGSNEATQPAQPLQIVDTTTSSTIFKGNDSQTISTKETS